MIEAILLPKSEKPALEVGTAIYEAGYKAGHAHLAAKFTAFTTACKSPAASLSEGNVEPLTASATLGQWATKAYAALKGAEVLGRCLADAKVDLCEALNADHFLGNNDNYQAIAEVLRVFPNALHELPPPCGSECNTDAHGG